eukprot:9488073-Pyramimonas_sp.AAC.1
MRAPSLYHEIWSTHTCVYAHVLASETVDGARGRSIERPPRVRWRGAHTLRFLRRRGGKAPTGAARAERASHELLTMRGAGACEGAPGHANRYTRK